MTEFEWLNEPKIWSANGTSLELTTELETDFWQTTHYGFQHDNGHAYLTEVTGDFCAEVAFTGRYEELYDQAGILVRIDRKNWIKAGIEFTDGMMHLSTVVTREISDWSVVPLHDHNPADPVFVRLMRQADAVRVQYHLGDQSWQMTRLCPFPSADARAGPTACSPTRQGFEASFHNISVGPARAWALHED